MATWRDGLRDGAQPRSLAAAACAGGKAALLAAAAAWALTFGSGTLAGPGGGTEIAAVAVAVAGAPERSAASRDISGQWLELFRSAALNRAVEQALRAHPDVAAAAAALKNAQAPDFPLSLNGSRIILGYLPDVFLTPLGTPKTAAAARQGARLELDAALVTLSSTVVVTMVQEASVRAQLTATERLLALQQQLTGVVRRKLAAGAINGLDAATEESALTQAQAALPPLRRQLARTRQALGMLLGQPPAAAPAGALEVADLKLSQSLPSSVPSKLIEQRPDVRQAEMNLRLDLAAAQAVVSPAQLLPQFPIDAQLQSSAAKLAALSGPYESFWLGGSLTQALYAAGALRRGRRSADSALDRAGAQYRAAVIVGCQNVADALRALQIDSGALGAAAASAEEAGRALEFAGQEYAHGTANPSAVVTAEQAEQQAQIALVRAQTNRYADAAGLFQTLGGGWWRPESRLLMRSE